jgi:hypothetical protein
VEENLSQEASMLVASGLFCFGERVDNDRKWTNYVANDSFLVGNWDVIYI